MNNYEEGGCFCGSIRYRIKLNDYPSSNCHCSMCRRISGASYVSWMAIPIDCFEYNKGKPKKLFLHLTELGIFVKNVELL